MQFHIDNNNNHHHQIYKVPKAMALEALEHWREFCSQSDLDGSGTPPNSPGIVVFFGTKLKFHVAIPRGSVWVKPLNDNVVCKDGSFWSVHHIVLETVENTALWARLLLAINRKLYTGYWLIAVSMTPLSHCFNSCQSSRACCLDVNEDRSVLSAMKR